jgi:hypothetical protein
VEYLNYLVSVIIIYAICAREIKSRLSMAKLEIITFQQQIGLNFKEVIESATFGHSSVRGRNLEGHF